MTPTAIAAKLRQHSPGCLPESIDSLGPLSIEIPDKSPLASPGDTFTHFLPDDIAEAVLRDAMAMDATGFMRREMFGTPAWEASQLGAPDKPPRIFHDADHGGSLGACYAAWLFSKGLPHA